MKPKIDKLKERIKTRSLAGITDPHTEGSEAAGT